MTDALDLAPWQMLADVPARSTNHLHVMPDGSYHTNRVHRLTTPRQP